MDENSNEKSEKEESEKECKSESMEKINFLNALGLITTATCSELQNKRAERKRRSTANPHFVYSNLELPTVNILSKYIHILYCSMNRVRLSYIYFISETKKTLVPAIWKCSSNSTNNGTFERTVASTGESCTTEINVTASVENCVEIFDSSSKVYHTTEYSSKRNGK